ncbi:MAG: hypothetical protein KAW17_03740 [Candidatus Eisenbacteria sp.]|nr:hypothetical protein [Candidatus Eisenbacteria bacterium]
MRFLCALLLLACLSVPISSAHAATWQVPTDAPTIQAGIDSASAGDTVLVACGTYYEHDIVMKSGITLRSETGEPECVTIDAQQLGRVIYCENVDTTSTIQGFTITGGTDPLRGGGMTCEHSSPRITRCIFLGNVSEDVGGGLKCVFSHSTISDCEFRNNFASDKGGGIHASSTGGPPMNLTNVLFVENSTSDERDCYGGGMYSSGGMVLTNVTFLRNSAWGGGAVWCRGAPIFDRVAFIENDGGWGAAIEFYLNSHPSLTNATFVSNSPGSAIYCNRGTTLSLERTIICFSGYSAIGCDETAVASLTCCDLYGNEGGDYVDCADGQYGINGNISEDPLFCDLANGDLTLHANSPCAPFTQPNPECDLIGAFPIGCGITAVAEPQQEDASWSSIKALYR